MEGHNLPRLLQERQSKVTIIETAQYHTCVNLIFEGLCRQRWICAAMLHDTGPGQETRTVPGAQWTHWMCKLYTGIIKTPFVYFGKFII